MSLNEHLTTLESDGLVRVAQLQPELEYIFRHALIQDAAYRSLVKTDRRMVHSAVGQALEWLYASQADTARLAPVLAKHFAEAGDQGQALHYYTAAGRMAASTYANVEALEYF
jgi:predicted ATPase